MIDLIISAIIIIFILANEFWSAVCGKTYSGSGNSKIKHKHKPKPKDTPNIANEYARYKQILLILDETPGTNEYENEIV